MRKELSFFLFLGVIILLGCNSRNSNEDKSVFRYNEPGGITSLDPAFTRNIENIWACNQLFNGLVQIDDNLKIQPSIAESWSISEDGKEYTFKLRNDVFFHDHEVFEGGNGRQVTADDFVYSFSRVMNPDLASPGVYILSILDKSEISGFVGVKALDSQTLKIYLNRTYPPFLGILTMQYFSVVPKEIVEYYESDFRRNPVGTGPFVFKNWVEGTKLVMVKNHNYFEWEDGVQLPKMDAISVSFVKDRHVAFLDFLRGRYDYISGLESTFKDKVLTPEGELNSDYLGKFNMVKLPYIKTDYLGILIDNDYDVVKNSPLSDKYIRKAMNYGFDRRKMVKYLRNNIGKPAESGFVPFGMPSYDEKKVKGYEFNPQKASEMLINAGFPNGDGLPPITITTPKAYQYLCEFIQHDLGEIGMKIKIDVIDEAAYREMVSQGKLAVFRKSWVADYPDAENFLSLFYSKNFCPEGPNYSHFSNYEFDKLYEESMSQVDDNIRYEMYRKMDQIVIDEAPIIPLFYDEVVYFVQNGVQDLSASPMHTLDLKRVYKKPVEE